MTLPKFIITMDGVFRLGMVLVLTNTFKGLHHCRPLKLFLPITNNNLIITLLILSMKKLLIL